MRILKGYVLSALITVAISVASASAAARLDNDNLRPWTVRDSTAVRYFMYDWRNPNPLDPNYSAADRDKPAVLSPDGRHFMYVSFHGDPARDHNVGTLYVQSVKAVHEAIQHGARESLRPMRQVHLSSSHGDDWQAPIIAPRWLDERRIHFLGFREDDVGQVYEFDITTGELSQLTNSDRVVTSQYAIARDRPDARPSVIYVNSGRELKSSVLDTPLDVYPAAVLGQEGQLSYGEDDPMESLFHPWKSFFATRKVYASYQGSDVQMVGRVEGADAFLPALTISPDGRYAVMADLIITLPKDFGIAGVPPLWRQYEQSKERHWFQYSLVDMKAARHSTMLDAPVGSVTKVGSGLERPFGAYWSKDGETVVLFNTALPLTESVETRSKMSYLVSYDVSSGQWTELAPMAGPQGRIESAQWLKKGETLLLKRTSSDTSSPNLTLSYRNGEWHLAETTVKDASEQAMAWPQGMQVYIQEDLNTPQTLMARIGARSVVLSEPDPALQGVRRQAWEMLEIPWRDRMVRGALLRPAHGTGPAPLVIQMGDLGLYYTPERDPAVTYFRPDGEMFSSFAAQALAAQGFAVLHLESPIVRISDGKLGIDASLMLSPEEGPAHVESVDAAIDLLVERGIVDPTRVGLVGFSRSGYHVYHVISHPGKYALDAAVIFDSVDGGYGSYINGMAIGQQVRVYERQYANVAAEKFDSKSIREAMKQTPSFWENKQAWLQGAPAFNLDRVSTPTLFSAVGRNNAWVMMETLGAWRYMGIPFEYHFYPDGQHILKKPKEREFAMQGTVDWMKFWLMDQAPDDSSRAAAWQSMKEGWSQRVTSRE